MRILLVDDDAEVRDLLGRALHRDGHVVVSAASTDEARTQLASGEFDVGVFDMALPDGTGIALCRELRAVHSMLPVLILTAHSDVDQRVRALDSGADDFLGKPFAVAELRARVRALGRRRGTPVSIAALTRGDLRIDFATRRVVRANLELELTAREWTILDALAAQPKRVLSRTQLLEECWGQASSANAASLEVLISRIRRKLGDGVIRTLRGVGYALDAS